MEEEIHIPLGLVLGGEGRMDLVTRFGFASYFSVVLGFSSSLVWHPWQPLAPHLNLQPKERFRV